MLISVIIPSFKPGLYLWECLDSICAQTFPRKDFEVILVLNGCKSPFEERIIEYINVHTTVQWKFIQTDEGGVSNARNIGLDVAIGKYICFIDDDDFVSPTYLEQLFMHAAPDVVPVCKPLSFIDGSIDFRPYNITKDYDKFHAMGLIRFQKPKRFFNGPVYKLIHRDVIGSRRFDERFKNGEDSLFMFLISDRFRYVDFTDETAIYYRRIRNDSATGKNNSLKYKINNYLYLILLQSSIYFKNIRKYNFFFYINSVIGRIKSILFD